MLALKEKGSELPAVAVALSPWTDLTVSGESWKTNEPVDNLTWRGSGELFSKYYCAGKDPADPLISPLFGDLAGLPPLLIYAGSHEMMFSDSTRFAEKAKKAGVDATLKVGEGLFHCYPACAPAFPEATKALKEIGRFINLKLD